MTAGDIFTATELADHLRLHFHVDVTFLYEDSTYYDAKNVDVLIAMLPNFNPTRIVNARPSLVKVAWMRNWFHLWMTQPWLGHFNLLLSSSPAAKDMIDDILSKIPAVFKTMCTRRCPVAYKQLADRRSSVYTGCLRLATNKNKFR